MSHPQRNRADLGLMFRRLTTKTALLVLAHCFLTSWLTLTARAQPLDSDPPAQREDVATKSASESTDQSNSAPSTREAALMKMLSGATLEGSFTNTSVDHDTTKLSREKYTLGEVKKLSGLFWLIPARIEYGEHDVTLPITVPVEWAGDTPVIVVDTITLPRFGTVSARVMFFDDHYAGYWKHGANGGHLFGTIRRDEAQGGSSETPHQ